MTKMRTPQQCITHDFLNTKPAQLHHCRPSLLAHHAFSVSHHPYATPFLDNARAHLAQRPRLAKWLRIHQLSPSLDAQSKHAHHITSTIYASFAPSADTPPNVPGLDQYAHRLASKA